MPSAGATTPAEENRATKSTSTDRPAPGSGSHSPKRTLNPIFLAYLVGPLALVGVLLVMHFGGVARESAWLWVGVFVILPSMGLLGNHLHDRNPSNLRLHARVAAGTVALTTTIYLSGWGPVLAGGFAVVALENLAHVGSRAWRITALWSLVGITVGQAAIRVGWAPTFLSLSQGNALALVGALVLVFIIRMAGETMEQKEEAEDRFRSLIQNSSDTTLVISSDGTITYASPAVALLLGFEPDEITGHVATDYVHPDERDQVTDRLGTQLQISSESVPVQFRMARRDGTWCDVEAVVADQCDRPSVGGFVANVRDITERKEFEAQLAHRALHDPLTGLANRQLILDRAEQMLARSRRSFDPPAAYFIDLDNFKVANDSLGHEAGDVILRAVADRLSPLLRSSDTLGRLGGDEFVILTEGGAPGLGPMVVAERVREALHTPIYVDGFEHLPITVTASIGVAVGDRSSAQELLRDADIALYRAKAAGRDCCVLFEAAMQTAALLRQELKSDLDSALANHEFFLLYQPIFDLDDSHVRGVEALIRWQHPTRGVIPPDEFIPILEDSGMIVDVGRWVLNEACAQAAEWHRQGLPTTMSVNVSMRQLEADALVDDVREALRASNLAAQSLVIEVTESNLMRDANATVSRLRKLKEIGVMVAIDDFGTGYSSLAYLRQFPVDVLKIDRSFIAEMDGRSDAAALIHTLVDLGRTLGLVTIAEGIEDQTQLDGLRDEQCDRGQGFIFSRPVEPAAIESLLRHSDPSVGSSLAVPDRA